MAVTDSDEETLHRSPSGERGTSPPRAVAAAKAVAGLWRRRYVWILSALALCAAVGVSLGFTLSEFVGPDPLEGPRVNLNYTTYVGTKLGSNINVFLGMRYAAPPLGDLRWRPPVEPEQEGGVQRAKAFGPICLATGAPYPNNDQAEDCLYVNVWAPADATPDSKLPVWLFIQGGGYTANSNANYDGEAVVKRSGNSIVFVNFNYRVGLWGFLASEKVRKDGALNVGLLDQRFVMRWVQKHIHKFGGDPNHVVIDGVSAGAGSVALHMTAFGGRDEGLFVGGIVQSLFFPAQPTVAGLEWQFDRLAGGVGCSPSEGQAGVGGSNDTSSSQMDCLRGKDIRRLQLANSASPFPGRDVPPLPLFYWTPCVDGDLIPELPYTLFEKGRFVDIPLLIGTDTDEGSYFGANAATQNEMRDFLQNNYPGLRDSDLSRILDKYPLMDPLPAHEAWFPSTSRAYGEATFICPTVNILDDMVTARSNHNSNNTTTINRDNATSIGSDSNTKQWVYRYNVQDEENIRQGVGVPHTFETAAVFGPESIGGARASYWTYNAPIVPLVMDYWISFVRRLDPNEHRNAVAPRWEPWDAAAGGSPGSGSGTDTTSARLRSRLVIETGNTRMERTPQDEVARCQFWKSMKEATQQKNGK